MGSIAASFDYGLNAAATEYDGQNKYLRITDIDDTTHEFLKSDLTTPLADLAVSADYLLEEGDLLFARTGASVGKTYLYRQYDGTVYFAGFLIRARIGESANPEFVYQVTLTDAYKKYVAITSQRSGQPGVNAQEYADYQLRLPSRTEQQQIGMTLRSLDTLITLHQRMCSIFCFCAFGSRTNFNQSSKDSFGYYAASVPCRRCARCHRRWLQAPLTSPRRLRFRFFLRWRFDRLASARKNSIISLMRCRSGSLSSPLRGSVACVSRVLDS